MSEGESKGSKYNLDDIFDPLEDGPSSGVKIFDKSAAKKEQKEEYDPYKEQSDKNNFDQRESLKKIFHWGAKMLLRVLASSISILIVIRFFLLVLPSQCRWLSESEISEIDNLFQYIIIVS